MPQEVPLVDSLYSTRQFQRGDLRPALAFDPAAAGRLLDEAGWEDSDGDGVRERGGEPLSFSLLVSTGGGASFPAHEREAILVQEQLRRVGVAVEIDVVDGMAIRERWERGDFEATIYDVLALTRYQLFGEPNPMGLDSPELFQDRTEILTKPTPAP